MKTNDLLLALLALIVGLAIGWLLAGQNVGSPVANVPANYLLGSAGGSAIVYQNQRNFKVKGQGEGADQGAAAGELHGTDHLVCYPILPSENHGENDSFDIEYDNQLEQKKITIGPAELFCVPSIKLSVDCVDLELALDNAPFPIEEDDFACLNPNNPALANIPSCCVHEHKAVGISCPGSQVLVHGIAAFPLCKDL